MRNRDAHCRFVAACALAAVGFAAVALSASNAQANNNASSSAAPSPTVALEKLQPAERAIAAVVDHYIDACLSSAKVQPAPAADDANLVRRLTLDLVGRVPTPLEVQEFVASRAADKREKLVDRLIASEAFADHQVNEFDWLLMQGQGNLRGYLTDAFRDKRSWDTIFRELLRPVRISTQSNAWRLRRRLNSEPSPWLVNS